VVGFAAEFGAPSQEHLIVTVDSEPVPANGAAVLLTPRHIDTTVAQSDRVYLVGDRARRVRQSRHRGGQRRHREGQHPRSRGHRSRLRPAVSDQHQGPVLRDAVPARHIADGGRIINIASSSTSRPHPGLGLYGTSKSAPKYLVQVLAQEIAHRKVTVNSLVPGPIEGAGIFAGVSDDDPYKKTLLDSVPIGTLASPEDVADIAEFLASDKSFFITGEEILMNGGSSN
jgi:NAD(P)-dependent dehydrogenase (short-subunit alcohol dehydrogenase family)